MASQLENCRGPLKLTFHFDHVESVLFTGSTVKLQVSNPNKCDDLTHCIRVSPRRLKRLMACADLTHCIRVSPRRLTACFVKKLHGKSWQYLCTHWQGINKDKVGKGWNTNYYQAWRALHVPGFAKQAFSTPGSKHCYVQFAYEKLIFREFYKLHFC